MDDRANAESKDNRDEPDIEQLEIKVSGLSIDEEEDAKMGDHDFEKIRNKTWIYQQGFFELYHRSKIFMI